MYRSVARRLWRVAHRGLSHVCGGTNGLLIVLGYSSSIEGKVSRFHEDSLRAL